MEEVTKLGKVSAQSKKDVARSGLGVAVRAGQRKPDIGTVEAFKLALLNAKSVAYATRGASGVHFMAVCERLGIAEHLKAKGKTRPTGMVAEFVLNGEAEFAVQQISELVSLKGVDLVGPFPKQIDLVSQIVAAASASTREAAASQAFITYLLTAEVKQVIKAEGMEPQ